MAKNNWAAFAGKRAFKNLLVEHVYANKPLKDYVIDRAQSGSTILSMMPVRASYRSTDKSDRKVYLLRTIASSRDLF